METITRISESPQQTELFARTIGESLKGGEIIELVSDLGGGKTTFTRGIATGAGSRDSVASPTFTISRQYKSPQFVIHHFDFYRLADAGLASHELADLINDPKIVIVVEWGGIVSDVLPEEKITVTINNTGDESRELKVQYHEKYNYLVEGI